MEKIEILGNTVTNEDVVRSEMLLDEGDPYSKVKVDKSISKLKSRRIFGSVKESTSSGTVPNSKIIITERNSKDVCLSIFKINFKNGFMNFAYDQTEIAEFYNLYFELIDFWKNILKDDIYEIKYEDLIKNSNLEIKKLIDHCGLDWDENCLNHHNNKSAIKTASVNQARKPIYQSSKNTNQYYSKYLQGMFGLLKK